MHINDQIYTIQIRAVTLHYRWTMNNSDVTSMAYWSNNMFMPIYCLYMNFNVHCSVLSMFRSKQRCDRLAVGLFVLVSSPAAFSLLRHLQCCRRRRLSCTKRRMCPLWSLCFSHCHCAGSIFTLLHKTINTYVIYIKKGKVVPVYLIKHYAMKSYGGVGV
jgi:hypothetical protein